MTIFKHPLARHVKIWPTAGIKGKILRVMVIVTTLELGKEHKKFKADKVAKLSEAAKTWIAENPTEAVDFMLVSRPKGWGEDADIQVG